MAKDTVILKDGKVIDSFDEVKVSESNDLSSIKIKYNNILALVILLSATIIIFVIYYKKVK